MWGQTKYSIVQTSTDFLTSKERSLDCLCVIFFTYLLCCFGFVLGFFFNEKCLMFFGLGQILMKVIDCKSEASSTLYI